MSDVAGDDRSSAWPGHPAPADPASWPEAWLRLAGDGAPPTAEVVTALARASRSVDRYRGPNPGRSGPARPSREGLDLVRSIVRDSLHAAPQPVKASWVKYSLAVVAGLVAAAETDGPLPGVGRLATERVRARHLHHQRADLAESTRGTYRSRLDLVLGAVTDQDVSRAGRPGLAGAPVTAPGAPGDEAALLAWAAGTRPATRRRRLLAVLGLSLGCGARLAELAGVRAEDVAGDDGGVHFILRNAAGTARTVTCRAAWEDVVRRAVPAEPDRLLVAPTRTSLQTQSLSGSLARAAAYGPPAGFSPTELRNTWLVRHLEAGTPLSVILPAADLDGTGFLERLLPHSAADPSPRSRLRLTA